MRLVAANPYYRRYATAARKLIDKLREENTMSIKWMDLSVKKQATEIKLNKTTVEINGTILSLKPIKIAPYVPLNENFSNNNLSPKEIVVSEVDRLTTVLDTVG